MKEESTTLTEFVILNATNWFINLIYAGILERGITIDGLGSKSFITYESNILFALRFMIDCNIVGGNWIEVPSGKYKKSSKLMSYCQLEVDSLYPFSVIESLDVF
jgi:DNA polymerase family B, exonuclease domain